MTQSEFEQIAQELRSQMLKVAQDFFGSNDHRDGSTDHFSAKALVK